MNRTPWLVALLLLLVTHYSFLGSSAQDEGSLFLPLLMTTPPELANIHGSFLVDGEQGRVYTQAEVYRDPRTVVLQTGDGSLLDSFKYTGLLALDRSNQRLLVDEGDAGVAVLDALSGALLGTVTIPGSAAAAPQIDSETGTGFVFRDSSIYVVDVNSQAVLRTVPLGLSIQVCDEEQGPAPITRSFYDLVGDVLYVAATTRTCTPFRQDTLVSYNGDLDSVGAFELPSDFQAVPFAGNLYGTSVLNGYDAFGLSYWALNAVEEWYSQTIPGSDAAFKGIVVDWQRGLLYEAVWETPSQGAEIKMIRISRTQDRTLLDTVAWEQLALGDAYLAGHDPHTDQLYFVEAGTLRILPSSAILPSELEALPFTAKSAIH